MTRLSAMILFAAAAAFAASCSDSPSSPSSTPGNTFTLRLRDTREPLAPNDGLTFADARAVLVTFSSLRAFRNETDWTAVPFANGATARTCDLTRLQRGDEVLGTAALPAGHYTQVRLVVKSAVLSFDSPSDGTACGSAVPVPTGSNATLQIPFGEVTLNREFDITPGKATTMLLEFNGSGSIRQTGSGLYTMTPMISVAGVS